MAEADDPFKESTEAVEAALDKIQRLRLAGKRFHIYARKSPGPTLGPGRSTGRPADED